MGATTERDRQRLALEDILALLVSAETGLTIAWTRMLQNAVTEEDAADLHEVTTARRDVREAKARLARFHPQHLEGER